MAESMLSLIFKQCFPASIRICCLIVALFTGCQQSDSEIKNNTEPAPAENTVTTNTPPETITSETPAVQNFKLHPSADSAWRGFRGTQRHAQTSWLPPDFKKVKLLWNSPLHSPALGGLAADENIVIASGRDAADTRDIFYGVDAKTGELLWTHEIPVTGMLDYGNSPRATPWLAEKLVYTLNAFGQLDALDLKTGKPVWQKNLVSEFSVKNIPEWGYAASPLIVDNKLIVQPGSPDAAIVALNPENGNLIWKTPGVAPAYSSLIAVELNGKKQLIGHDSESLGSWDLATGNRNWRYEFIWGAGHFVSSPQVYQDKILVNDEIHGAQLFSLNENGSPKSEPIGQLPDFTSQTHTPIIWKNRFLGIFGVLFAADLDHQLKEADPLNDASFDKHSSMIASPERVLIITANGKLLLIDPATDVPEIRGRITLPGDEKLLYSYPAIVGNKLFIRMTTDLICISLGDLP